MKFKLRSDHRLSSVTQDQSGVASVYVSIGIIGVLSLISISFAFLMQTEYIQARDRQFNTQARIAAETAINDARQIVYKAIGNRLNLSQFIALRDNDGNGYVDISDAMPPQLTVAELEAEISFYDASGDGAVDFHDDILQRPYETLLVEEWYDCGDVNINQADQFEGDLDGSESIEYTCVEVDGRPVKLVYDTINTNRSENVLIQTRRIDNSGGFIKSNVDKLTINWQGTTSLKNFQPAATHQQKLPSENNWGPGPPMLKVQIIPLNIRDGWTREELSKSTRTYFLYPTGYADNPAVFNNEAKVNLYDDSIPQPITDNNKIINADCDGDVGDRHCAVEISGFNGIPGTCSDNTYATEADCQSASEIWTSTNYTINNADGDTGNEIGNRTDGTCSDNSYTTEADCQSASEIWTMPGDDEMVYIVLVRSIYGDANLAISAQNKNSEDLRFVNQQINITSTGRAGGLTYRLREVIPIRPKYIRPEEAIDSAEHICKILIGEPDTGVRFDYGQFDGLELDDHAFCKELHP